MAMPSPPPSLLLLPAPPLPSSKPALNAAYRAPLTAVLTRLRADLESASTTSSPSTSPTPTSSSTLVVAVACPVLHGPAPRRKSLRWRAAQALLAGIYTLLSAICAERAIPVCTGGSGSGAGEQPGIDARVLLVDHAPRRRYEPGPAGAPERNRTVVYDLACFAAEVRPWRAVFHPSSEAGYELLAAYLALAEGRQALLQSQLVAVEGGLSLSLGGQMPRAGGAAGGTGSSARDDHDHDHDHDHLTSGHRAVCLGGTFDHLHAGHKLLLHAAALLLCVPEERRGPQAVFIIGLSDDELLRKKKFAEELQPWATRADNVIAFLSTVFNGPPAAPETNGDGRHGHDGRAEHGERRVTFRDGAVLVRLAVLRDPYGPTTAEEDVDALVLSGETRSGGRAINEARREKGWRPMEVYEIDVLDANGVMDDEGGDGDEAGTHAARNGFAAKISSTAIRQQIAERRAAKEKT